MRIASALFLVFLFAAQGRAAELVRFHFNNGGANIVETTPWTATRTFSAGLRAFGTGSAGIVKGAGLTAGTGNDSWRAYSTMTASGAQAIAGNHYLTFTIQAAAGQALDLDGGAIRLTARASGAAANFPEFVTLLTSVDGFEASKTVATAAWSNGNTVTLPLSGTRFNNQTGPVEFRLYIHRDDANAANVAGYSLIYSTTTTPARDDLLALDGVIVAERVLAAPTGLTATPQGENAIALAWQDNTAHETAYLVEASPNGVGGWTQLASLPANTTAYTHTGLTAGSLWFYRLRGTSPYGNTPDSAIISATTTGGTAPNGASGLSATLINATKGRLDWLDSATGETGFRVESAPSASGPWTALQTVPAGSILAWDRDLYPENTYHWRVVPVFPEGDGTPSPLAGATTPATSSLNFLVFGNSYSHFYEYLPSIAAERGDTLNLVPYRNANEVHEQLQAEQDAEDGLRTLPAYSTEASDGFRPLETDYNTYIRMKTILDQCVWDVISYQPHSSYANKVPDTTLRLDGVRAWFDQAHHEPGNEVVFYLTTAYRNDEHLFRNLVNASAHFDTTRPGYPYTEDQHAFDSLVVAETVTDPHGLRIVPGGLALQNARYHALVGETFPDPYFDYFNAASPAKPLESSLLHAGLSWSISATNPKFAWAVDSHPGVALNYLTACVWYETLFRKSVLPVTYRPAELTEARAAALRQIAHDTVLGLLPPLRLAHPASRLAYGDHLWNSVAPLQATGDPERLAIAIRNLETLVAFVPEHPRVAEASAQLSSAGRLAAAQVLAAREAAERPHREAFQLALWNSSTAGQPITASFALTEDPDADGLPNYAERALALNPFGPDPAAHEPVTITESEGAHWLTLTHQRDTTGASTASISVEASTTLAPESWTPSQSAPTFTPPSPTPTRRAPDALRKSPTHCASVPTASSSASGLPSKIPPSHLAERRIHSPHFSLRRTQPGRMNSPLRIQRPARAHPTLRNGEFIRRTSLPATRNPGE